MDKISTVSAGVAIGIVGDAGVRANAQSDDRSVLENDTTNPTNAQQNSNDNNRGSSANGNANGAKLAAKGLLPKAAAGDIALKGALVEAALLQAAGVISGVSVPIRDFVPEPVGRKSLL